MTETTSTRPATGAPHSTVDGLVPFPAEFADRYLTNGSWRPDSLAQEFRFAAQRTPDRTALICGETEWTYAELDRRADRRAAGLLEQGFEPGAAVLLQVNNTAETVLTWYALLKAGLVPVCTLSIHRQHEIGAISQQVTPVAHIVDADNPRFDLVEFALGLASSGIDSGRLLTLGDRRVDGVSACADLDLRDDDARAGAVVDAVQERLDPSDIAVFQLSGGTTGTPKVIPRLHGEYWFNALAYARRLGWTEADRVAYIGPMVHNAGIICGIHGPHAVGAAAILGPPDLPAVYDLLARTESTDIVLGPFAYDVAIAPELSRATALRRVLFSGKKVPQQHFSRLRDMGVWSGQLFGMGEGLCMVTPLDSPEEARAQTVGTALAADDEVRLLDPAGDQQVQVGTVGELCARGPYTIRGYYAAPEHNRRAFTEDGFYRTGDLAAERVIDGVSYYSIEGRIKDLINRGGEKINAEEMELLLVSHPGIREAALVAMPDQRLGERACAFLVPDGEVLTMDEVRRHLEELGVAKYKWPERLVWLDTLPRRNAVGKIDKKGLRERASTLTAEPR